MERVSFSLPCSCLAMIQFNMRGVGRGPHGAPVDMHSSALCLSMVIPCFVFADAGQVCSQGDEVGAVIAKEVPDFWASSYPSQQHLMSHEP